MNLSVKNENKLSIAIIAVITGLIIGSVGSFFIGKNISEKKLSGGVDKNSVPLRDKSGDYQFIKPLLLCNISEPKDVQQFRPIEDIIKNFIATLPNRQSDIISFYFRDLVTGQWTGTNESERYFPASLLKVPTAIAFYKLAETQPELLSKKIFFDGKLDANAREYFKPSQTLHIGESYTIEELLRRMIIYSDNNAVRLLHSNIDPGFLQEVYSDLGIELPDVNESSDFITVKEYSLFFRLLFNATYLNREFSEKILTLLTGSDFSEGIRVGVPTNIPVAQKFGETQLIDPETQNVNVRELHDCGIIYYPNHPYLLCIMTKGNSFENLTQDIKKISQLVYDWIDQQFND